VFDRMNLHIWDARQLLDSALAMTPRHH